MPGPAYLPPESSLSAAGRARIEAVLIAVALCLYGFCAVTLHPTTDEVAHLNRGIHYLSGGRLHLDPNNPPLPAIYALPADILDAPRMAHLWAPLPEAYRAPALLTCRLWALVLFLAACWFTSRLAARLLGGARVGLASLALMLFGPTFAAHGHLVTTDMPFAFVAVWLLFALHAWVERGGLVRTALLGVAVGLNLAAKYSSLVWLAGAGLGAALWLVVGLCAGRIRRGDLWDARARVRLVQLAAAGAVAVVVLAGVYRFESWGGAWVSLDLGLRGLGPLAIRFPWLRLPLPDAWVIGLDHLLADTDRWAYFAGQWRPRGDFPLYFATLLAMKLPFSVLALLGMAAAAGLRRNVWAKPTIWLYAIPALVFLVYASLFGGVQIGVRHVLPVVMLAYLGGAWGAMAWRRAAWRLAGVAFVVALVCRAMLVTPHQLAWFNALAGGPQGAWRWFADSNQDWNQGWSFIRMWAERREIEVEYHPVQGETVGWAAVSTYAYVHPSASWLRSHFQRERFVDPCWHVFRFDRDDWHDWQVVDPTALPYGRTEERRDIETALESVEPAGRELAWTHTTEGDQGILLHAPYPGNPLPVEAVLTCRGADRLALCASRHTGDGMTVEIGGNSGKAAATVAIAPGRTKIVSVGRLLGLGDADTVAVRVRVGRGPRDDATDDCLELVFLGAGPP